ncbi:MAG TPA: response regulator [Bryobacteraceae bacterium]|nr:response regulator [Bryobacteraceae bacterium]
MADPRNPVRIFIVEDSDSDVFLVEEALRTHGIDARLRRFHDGEEALNALSPDAIPDLPDIVIIDLNLPKITGFEVLRHVRGLPSFDSVPVLILTSSQLKADRELALRLGADAYIAKLPTLPEFLSSVGSGVRGLLGRLDKGAGAQDSSSSQSMSELLFARPRTTMRRWYCRSRSHAAKPHATGSGPEEKLRQREGRERGIFPRRPRRDDRPVRAERRG